MVVYVLDYCSHFLGELGQKVTLGDGEDGEGAPSGVENREKIYETAIGVSRRATNISMA